MGGKEGPSLPLISLPRFKLRCQTQNFRGLPVTLDPTALGATGPLWQAVPYPHSYPRSV